MEASVPPLSVVCVRLIQSVAMTTIVFTHAHKENFTREKKKERYCSISLLSLDPMIFLGMSEPFFLFFFVVVLWCMSGSCMLRNMYSWCYNLSTIDNTILVKKTPQILSVSCWKSFSVRFQWKRTSLSLPVHCVSNSLMHVLGSHAHVRVSCTC